MAETRPDPTPPPPANPAEDVLSGGPRGEVLGCPTGLSDIPPDAAAVHGPLGVEKLEGRQESGRDAQDDNEEDEPPD